VTGSFQAFPCAGDPQLWCGLGAKWMDRTLDARLHALCGRKVQAILDGPASIGAVLRHWGGCGCGGKLVGCAAQEGGGKNGDQSG